MDIAIIVTLLAISLPFLVTAGQVSAWTVAATATALLGALSLALLFIAASRGRGDDLLQRLFAWLPARISDRLMERYRQFRDGALLSLRGAPMASVWGLLGWLAEVARLFLVTQALDIHLSPALIVFATVANSLLTLAPTPGGVGAVEAGLTGLLKQLSSLATPAVAALVLVDRSISYLSVIAVGAALFLLRWALGRKGRPPPNDSPAPFHAGG